MDRTSIIEDPSGVVCSTQQVPFHEATPLCGEAQTGKACAEDGDCTGYCAATALVCVTSHCDDEKQSGNETGVDCGGACLLCIGDDCTQNSQCKSGKCDVGDTDKCIPQNP
jgi:hypothetical protein